MTPGFWIISISVCIVAVAFVALVIFLGVTLLSLRHTISDLDDKIHSFDPIFRVVSKTGDVIEKKTSRMYQISEEAERSIHDRVEEKRERIMNTALEVAEWTLVGVALWQKIRERK